MSSRFGERFLGSADLFPARLAGEAWGRNAVAVDFGGGPYVFAGLSAEQEAAARERFAGFCRQGALPREGVECRVLRVSPEEFRSFDLRGFELTLDLDAQADAVRVAGLGLMARLEWRPSLAAALWTASSGDDAFPGVLENVLRVLAAYRVAECGGALLHSAGIVDGGAAWLFVGRSGAGKSTLSRLSLGEGRAVLSDDLNAVSWGAEGCWVSAVPFAGDYHGAASAILPLGALCQVRQGQEHHVEPLSRAEGLAALLAAAPYVNQDPHRLDRLLSNLEAVLDRAPLHRVTFSLEGGVWNALLAAHEVRV